ncbi:MAG: hypothetical protein A2020_08905 [Lentisphaerae bacterium GWF2_45_14]|nr:MAG: hypothetical protein A2020_08905 [Lentisphaerae bacterium GWF2_45_14]
MKTQLSTVFLILAFSAALCGAEEKSFEALLSKAKDGDAYSQGAVASIYRRGRSDVRKDYIEAFKWATHSSVQNHPLGIFNLAVIYENGLGVKAEPAEAQALYEQSFAGLKKLSDEGDPLAQGCLGFMYLTGKGVKKDPAAAEKYLLASAGKESSAAAFHNLGYLYLSRNNPADEEKAFEYFKKAAESGCPASQYQIGMMYLSGKGVPKDSSTAFRYISLAHIGGCEKAPTVFGIMLMDGIGSIADPVKAFKILSEEAKQGNVEASFRTGLIYLSGNGARQDSEKAFEFIKFAADKEHPGAMYALGAMYENGNGVGKDKSKAAELYKKAAALGIKEAEKKLKAM